MFFTTFSYSIYNSDLLIFLPFFLSSIFTVECTVSETVRLSNPGNFPADFFLTLPSGTIDHYELL